MSHAKGVRTEPVMGKKDLGWGWEALLGWEEHACRAVRCLQGVWLRLLSCRQPEGVEGAASVPEQTVP